MDRSAESYELEVRRPVLRYYGGAWRRALWTSAFFPDHKMYLEPCCGAASVLLRKQRAKNEVLNDLDGRVVNFFRVLRDQPLELIDRLMLTPWAEEEWFTAREPSGDPLEDARRFFLASWAGVRGGPNPGPRDFRWQVKQTRRSAAPKDIETLDHLVAAARRLRGVTVLNRDALSLIRRVVDADAGKGDWLIYFDPPYLHGTRSNRGGYRFEMGDDWHMEAAELLNRAAGPVVVAGYPSALYARLYERNGWRRHDCAFGTNSGGKRVEAVWMNRRVTSG